MSISEQGLEAVRQHGGQVGNFIAGELGLEMRQHDEAGFGADGFDQDRLGQRRHDDVIDLEIGILRLRSGPSGKRAQDVVAEDHH